MDFEVGTELRGRSKRAHVRTLEGYVIRRRARGRRGATGDDTFFGEKPRDPGVSTRLGGSPAQPTFPTIDHVPYRIRGDTFDRYVRASLRFPF